MAPMGIYSRLKAFVTGTREPEPPAISTTLAVSLLLLYTCIYVIPFYLSSTTRPSQTLSRDAPSVIRARVRSVTVSCIICSLSTLLVLVNVNGSSPSAALPPTLHSIGLWPIGFLDAAKSLALTAVLFAAPLFEDGIVDGAWEDWIRFRGLDENVGSWIGYRNLIAGPVTEEVLFRSCAVPLLLSSQTSNTTVIFATPVIFGLAHLHHFYEFRITHPHTPIVAAILRSLFQLTYTTLFGGYATFVYIRTGSLLAVILIHTFCNWRGLPRLWGRLKGPETVVGPDIGQNKRSEDAGKHSLQAELGAGWTISYYIILFAGAYGWYTFLWSWTESSNALRTF